MATGLEVVATSMTVARTSCTHAPSAYTSVLSGKSSKRSNLCLPTCTGLKIGVHAKGFTVSSDEKRRRGFKRVVCEAQETVAQVQNVSGSTWQSLVLESDVPVLVDFWAPWCGPCKIIDPLIDELAKQYAGKLRCFKLNTDESPHIATAYGIRSIPTVMLFKNGEKKDTVIGAVPKTTLTASIEKYVEW